MVQLLHTPSIPLWKKRARKALLTHAWPGNVRELRQKVMGAVLQAQEDVYKRQVLIRAIPKGLKVTFILSASICRMATAFFSFWAALIKIYSYFRLYTFMSIYVKNPADLVYVLSVTICKTIFDPQRG